MISTALAGLGITIGMFSMLLGGPFEPIGDWFAVHSTPVLEGIVVLNSMSS